MSSLTGKVKSLNDNTTLLAGKKAEEESNFIWALFPETKVLLNLSFRQINNFKPEGETASFYFYGLTTTRVGINQLQNLFIHSFILRWRSKK